MPMYTCSETGSDHIAQATFCEQDVEEKGVLFRGQERNFLKFFGLVYANVQFSPRSYH